MTTESLRATLYHNVKDQCACNAAREVARRLTRRYDAALKPTGIKATQFTILTVTALVPDASMTQLAEKLGMERTTFLRNLKPLERDGFIELSDERHQRARLVTVTPKGMEVLAAALPLWEAAQDRLKREIGADQWDQMRKSMQTLGTIDP